ncbi:Scube1 [Scenedesmus sp. PABB004]|nr:Scube1 [Scenedesmus sp. PABB004]
MRRMNAAAALAAALVLATLSATLRPATAGPCADAPKDSAAQYACRPWSFIYDSSNWDSSRLNLTAVYAARDRACGGNATAGECDALDALASHIVGSRVTAAVFTQGRPPPDAVLDPTTPLNVVLSYWTLRVLKDLMPDDLQAQSWLGFNEVINIAFNTYGMLCGMRGTNSFATKSEAFEIWLKTFPIAGGVMPGYNSVCGFTKRLGDGLTRLSRFGPLKFLKVPAEFMSRTSTSLCAGMGNADWQQQMTGMCNQDSRMTRGVMALINLNRRRTHYEPIVAWWLNVYVPTLARASQAIANAVVRTQVQDWVAAAAASGQLGANPAQLMYAAGTQPRLSPWAVCIFDDSSTFKWNVVGPRSDCDKAGWGSRRRLHGDGGGGGTGAAAAGGTDDTIWLRLDASPLSKLYTAVGGATEVLTSLRDVIDPPVAAIRPVVDDLKAFGGAVKTAYDIIMAPLVPIAAALEPAVTKISDFIDAIKCPADFCFQVCWWAPRWGCWGCTKCGTVCPLKFVCSLADLIMSALDWVGDFIAKLLGGAIDVIFKPLLDALGCKMDGLSLSCSWMNLPSLPTDALVQKAAELAQPFTDAADRFAASVTALLGVPLPDDLDLTSDNGSGRYLRTAFADGADAQVACANASYMAVMTQAQRVFQGCAFDYTSLLRFPCGNATSDGAASRCTLGYAAWSVLPHNNCNRTDLNIDATRSAFAEPDDGSPPVPLRGVDTLSLTYLCVDPTRVPLDSLSGIIITPDSSRRRRRRHLLGVDGAVSQDGFDAFAVVPGASGGLSLRASQGAGLAAAAAAGAPSGGGGGGGGGAVQVTVPAQGLTLMFEFRASAVSLSCATSDVSPRVTHAELGAGTSTADVTSAVAHATCASDGPCTLDASQLEALLGWSTPDEALQVKLACVCNAGTANVMVLTNSSAATTPAGCVPCLAGEYKSQDMGACARCPAGSVSGAPSSAACTQCSPGYFAAVQGQTNCTACPAGTYQPASGAATFDACLPCSPVETSTAGSAQCTACDPGTVWSNVTQGCAPCAGGTYRDANMTQCTSCAPGTWAAAGAASCTPCAPGTYAPDVAAVVCAPCPVGAYADAAGATVCTRCPNQTTTAALGSALPSDCSDCPTCAIDWARVAEVFDACWRMDNCTGITPPPESSIPRRLRLLLQDAPAANYTLAPPWLSKALDAAIAEQRQRGGSSGVAASSASSAQVGPAAAAAAPTPDAAVGTTSAAAASAPAPPADGGGGGGGDQGPPPCAVWLDAIRGASSLNLTITDVGNGICDNGPLNVGLCSYDGGDCCAGTCRAPDGAAAAAASPDGSSDLPADVLVCSASKFACLNPDASMPMMTAAAYVAPAGNCPAPDTSAGDANTACPVAPGDVRLANGRCDGDLNTLACGWDGGDCCQKTCKLNDLFWDSCRDFDCRDPGVQSSGCGRRRPNGGAAHHAAAGRRMSSGAAAARGGGAAAKGSSASAAGPTAGAGAGLAAAAALAKQQQQQQQQQQQLLRKRPASRRGSTDAGGDDQASGAPPPWWRRSRGTAARPAGAWRSRRCVCAAFLLLQQKRARGAMHGSAAQAAPAGARRAAAAAPPPPGPGPVPEDDPSLAYLLGLLEQIAKEDPGGVFDAPVDGAAVPGYADKIKHPMCFAAMRDALRARRYRTLRAFARDFELICENAKTFNPPQHRIHKLAINMQRAGRKLLQTHELPARRALHSLHPDGPRAAALEEEAAVLSVRGEEARASALLLSGPGAHAPGGADDAGAPPRGPAEPPPKPYAPVAEDLGAAHLLWDAANEQLGPGDWGLLFRELPDASLDALAAAVRQPAAFTAYARAAGQQAAGQQQATEQAHAAEQAQQQQGQAAPEQPAQQQQELQQQPVQPAAGGQAGQATPAAQQPAGVAPGPLGSRGWRHARQPVAWRCRWLHARIQELSEMVGLLAAPGSTLPTASPAPGAAGAAAGDAPAPAGASAGAGAGAAASSADAGDGPSLLQVQRGGVLLPQHLAAAGTPEAILRGPFFAAQLAGSHAELPPPLPPRQPAAGGAAPGGAARAAPAAEQQREGQGETPTKSGVAQQGGEAMDVDAPGEPAPGAAAAGAARPAPTRPDKQQRGTTSGTDPGAAAPPGGDDAVSRPPAGAGEPGAAATGGAQGVDADAALLFSSLQLVEHSLVAARLMMSRSFGMEVSLAPAGVRLGQFTAARVVGDAGGGRGQKRAGLGLARGGSGMLGGARGLTREGSLAGSFKRRRVERSGMGGLAGSIDDDGVLSPSASLPARLLERSATSIHIPSVREIPREEWDARRSAATAWRRIVAQHGPRNGMARPPPEVRRVLEAAAAAEGSSSEDTSDEAYAALHKPLEEDEHLRLCGPTGGGRKRNKNKTAGLGQGGGTSKQQQQAQQQAGQRQAEQPPQQQDSPFANRQHSLPQDGLDQQPGSPPAPASGSRGKAAKAAGAGGAPAAAGRSASGPLAGGAAGLPTSPGRAGDSAAAAAAAALAAAAASSAGGTGLPGAPAAAGGLALGGGGLALPAQQQQQPVQQSGGQPPQATVAATSPAAPAQAAGAAAAPAVFHAGAPAAQPQPLQAAQQQLNVAALAAPARANGALAASDAPHGKDAAGKEAGAPGAKPGGGAACDRSRSPAAAGGTPTVAASTRRAQAAASTGKGRSSSGSRARPAAPGAGRGGRERKGSSAAAMRAAPAVAARGPPRQAVRALAPGHAPRRRRAAVAAPASRARPAEGTSAPDALIAPLAPGARVVPLPSLAAAEAAAAADAAPDGAPAQRRGRNARHDSRRGALVKIRVPPRRARLRKSFDAPRRVDARPTDPGFEGRLLSEISSCYGPRQLAHLLRQFAPHLTAAHAAAALSLLAGMATGRELARRELEQTYHAPAALAAERLLARISQAGPLDCARAAYGLARLQLHQPALLDAVAAHTRGQLAAATPQALGGLAAGLAHWGHHPGDAWVQELCTEAFAQMSAFSAQDLANLLFALSVWRVPCSQAFLQRALAAFRGHWGAAGCHAPTLVRFAYALTQLPPCTPLPAGLAATLPPGAPAYQHHAEWRAARRLRAVGDALDEQQQQQQQQQEQEQEQAAWQLERAPDSRRGRRRSRGDGSYGGSGFLVPDGATPDEPGGGGGGGGSYRLPSFNWLVAFLAECRRQVDVMRPGELSTLLWACAELNHAPDLVFMRAWFRASAARMHAFTPGGLAAALAALGALQPGRGVPGAVSARWLSAALSRSREVLPDASGGELAKLLWGFAELRFWPGQAWMDGWQAAALPQLPGMAPEDLADAAWALGRLRYAPPEPWAAALSAAVTAALPDLSAADLARLIWAYSALRLRPERGWLLAFKAAAGGAYGGDGAAALARHVAGLLAQQNRAQFGGGGGGAGQRAAPEREPP